jgi:hypothetical protein
MNWFDDPRSFPPEGHSKNGTKHRRAKAVRDRQSSVDNRREEIAISSPPFSAWGGLAGMKQGSSRESKLLQARKAWNVNRIQISLALIGLGMFAFLYWRYGGPWILEPAVTPPKVPSTASLNALDQGITIPKIPGGVTMRPVPEEPYINGVRITEEKLGLESRWTPIANANDPGRLLGDVSSIHLWRKVERTAGFQYIPRPHTIDKNTNKPILYELIVDSFKCAEGEAVKSRLNVYYEDGTMQPYFPWGNATISGLWASVRPNTVLSREMKFVCSVQLTSDFAASKNEDRILGTWHVEDGAKGRISAGPLVISPKQIVWTAPDGQKCVSDYRVASLSSGSTFPGGPAAGNEPDNAYITFALELKGPHLEPCSQKMSSFTMSFDSSQHDLANFTAFFVAPQAYGTMRRDSSNKTFP